MGITIEIFSCSGGLAEGLQRAGITIDMAFDADAEACDSYERNLGHRPVQMDVRDLLRMVRGGWSPGPVDLMVADPPCTPWSRAGSRKGQDDERDMLGVTVEFIELLRPRAWLIANVPGLDDACNWEAVVKPVIGGMASRCGYCVDFARLNAADFGVPQKRIRPFWFGHPVGTPCIEWPHPTHCKPPVLPGCGIKPWVTCRQALEHLPIEDLGRPVRLRGEWAGGNGPNHRPTNPDETARTITKNTHSDGLVAEWPWDRPATTVHSDPRIPSPGHHDASWMSAKPEPSWPWDTTSTVVCSGPQLAPIGRNGRAGESQRGHPNAVVLSERAGAILQGFPDGWVFAGKTKRSRWSMIGQAMPPPLAEAVGRSIATWCERARSAHA